VPFKIILGHVSSSFIDNGDVSVDGARSVVHAAGNNLHSAHLHWLKGAWHGTVNNLRPNILETMCDTDVVITAD